jgi:5-methylcytosine-specific restriction endonuclease McrA
MPNNPRDTNPAWRQIRAARLKIDGYRCAVPGCLRKATHVDHIISRRAGGTDALSNLRSLCAVHDNQVKEDATGKRRSGGKFTVAGCDAFGMPKDPNHPWFRR